MAAKTKKTPVKKASKKKVKKKVTKKAAPVLRELTQEELIASATAHHDEYVDLMLTKAIPELRNLLTLLDSVIPCLQFQRAIQDVVSASEHLENLKDEGPKPRHSDVPLHDSEVEEDFEFQDEDEIEYAEEDEENQDEE